MKRITLAAGLAAAAIVATAGSASAATIAANGTGFVGKGEVQSAYGMNNAKLQDAVNANAQAFTFSTTQAASQSLSSSASQVVTEHASQSAHRVLSCTVQVGGIKNPRIFEADGSRDGSKVGSREGSRTGSRAGSLVGTLSAAINADPRKTGQWTGWNLKGYATGPSFNATGAESFDAPAYGDAAFTGDYAFGDVEWGGWQAEPGTNPADCLRNDNGAIITDLSDVTTFGDALVTGTEYGAESFGPTQYGAVSATGPVQMFVTYLGSTKPLTVV